MRCSLTFAGDWYRREDQPVQHSDSDSDSDLLNIVARRLKIKKQSASGAVGGSSWKDAQRTRWLRHIRETATAWFMLGNGWWISTEDGNNDWQAAAGPGRRRTIHHWYTEVRPGFDAYPPRWTALVGCSTTRRLKLCTTVYKCLHGLAVGSVNKRLLGFDSL